MNESTQHDLTSIELPRLRIHHFFVLTTVFAVVMSVWLGMWNLFHSYQPSQTVPKITSGVSFIVIVQSLSLSACAAVALIGLAWRKQEIPFPSQPGHWMAIYLTITLAYEIVLTFVSLFLQAQNQGAIGEFMNWAMLPMALAFHCFALVFWVVAYLHEPARIWKLGWAAMALKTLFGVCRTLLFLGRKCVEWLLETYWYQHYNWQFPFYSWGSYAKLMLQLPNYLLLAFLLAATVSDLRQHRRLHWSHWLVLISTFVSTSVSTVYYHLVF